MSFEIVGSQEADPMKKKLSNESPIGKALLGHKAGDVITANLPGDKKVNYRVINVD